MNGPEHYREAERLLNLSEQPGLPGGPVRMESVAVAQVHATLALASAQIETSFAIAYPQQGIRADWVEAVS